MAPRVDAACVTGAPFVPAVILSPTHPMFRLPADGVLIVNTAVTPLIVSVTVRFEFPE
jgi:hypothetical protein